MSDRLPPTTRPSTAGTRATHGASAWALGLSAAALVVSLCVAAFVAMQTLFGFPLSPFGWFAHAPSSAELEMGEPASLLNEGYVSVDASGGVAGEAVSTALVASFDPSAGRLRCQDVPSVRVDATSVCTQPGLPEQKVVVVFLDDSGRFVWTQVLTDVDGFLPRE